MSEGNGHIEDTDGEGIIAIPYRQLSEEALTAIIDEFVSREGTDYGDYQFSLSDKRQQVLQQLEQGSAQLLFDPIAQSCHIVLTETLEKYR